MILSAVLIGFGAGIIAPIIYKWFRSAAGWVLAIVPLGLTIYFASLFPGAASGSPLRYIREWSSELGINISFNADGLGLLFALLISGIGTLIVIYAGGYLKGNKDIGRFYAWLMVFMSAMLGVVLSDNLILLFIFWELTSLSSFILIGFKHEYDSSRYAAQQALLVTGLGGLAMLAGFILLGMIGGSMEISNLVRLSSSIQENSLYLPALILILIGAFTKSAQFPFHFWLPNAMEAPTPVSAYLHSATMVKAGIYLLARLHPVVGGTSSWEIIVTGAGLATMIAGSYLALIQTDLKRLLAYSTITALGTLTMLIGSGNSLAIKAAMVFLLAHALYKGALFMIAGSVDHEAGTRDITRLGGLARTMPVTAAAALVAALSMAGVPPLFGFIAKELLYETALEAGWWVFGTMAFTALVGIIVAGMVSILPFWTAKPHEPEDSTYASEVHEAPFSMWLGPGTLAGLSLITGLLPGLTGSFLAPAASASAGETIKVKLALWHGVNPVLLLSMGTLAAGTILFLNYVPIRRLLSQLNWSYGPARLYDFSLDIMMAAARGQTRIFQNGYLRYYMTAIVLTTVGSVGFTLFYKKGWHLPDQVLNLRYYEIALAVMILVAAINAARSPSRLTAVASLGAAGYGVALLYLIYGAPDLAMTQFLIESLTVILFVLAVYHLPRFATLTSKKERVRDVVISLLAGALMTVMVLSSLGGRLFAPISEYFTENSLPLAHGRNIVNVILVDFRGVDTLGEITVLAIAATGVITLLRLGRGKKKTGGSR